MGVAAPAPHTCLMVGLLYSIAAYVLFLASFTYFALFSDGVIVARTVDSGPPASAAVAAAANLALILLFGLQHSIMARAGFKRLLTRVIPAGVERATYVLVSSLVLILLMWQWRPMASVVWHVDHIAAAAVFWSVNAVGWLGVPLCSFLIDHFDLFGVKRALHAYLGITVGRKGFVTPMVYRAIRHPIMTSLMIGLWVTPHMTVGHALLAAGMTVYVVIGVRYEERSLVDELGDDYRRYQATTPRFLPLGGGRAPRA